MKGSIVIILATLLVITWSYFGSIHFYSENLSSLSNVEFAPAAFHFLSTAILLFFFPLIINKIINGQFLPENFKLFHWDKKTFIVFLICTLLMIIMSYGASLDPSFKVQYPFSRMGEGNYINFIFYSFCYFLFYYIPWEFFYRSFIQLNASRVFGFVPAILLQMCISTLAHIGKPTAEIYGAVIGGLFWGYWIKKEGSLLYPLLMHAALGISLDYFLLF